MRTTRSRSSPVPGASRVRVPAGVPRPGRGGSRMTDVQSDDQLLPRLVELVDASELGDLAGILVLAAYQGDDELAEALEGAITGRLSGIPTAELVHVPRAYLQRVTVTGFRGIG